MDYGLLKVKNGLMWMRWKCFFLKSEREKRFIHVTGSALIGVYQLGKSMILVDALNSSKNLF